MAVTGALLAAAVIAAAPVPATARTGVNETRDTASRRSSATQHDVDDPRRVVQGCDPLSVRASNVLDSGEEDPEGATHLHLTATGGDVMKIVDPRDVVEGDTPNVDTEQSDLIFTNPPTPGGSTDPVSFDVLFGPAGSADTDRRLCEIDHFLFSTARVNVAGVLPAAQRLRADLAGPTTVAVGYLDAAGGAGDANSDELDDVPAELVQLDLDGTLSVRGPGGPGSPRVGLGSVEMHLRSEDKHPNQRSSGWIQELTNTPPNTGTLELPRNEEPPGCPEPSGPECATSTYPVWFELVVPPWTLEKLGMPATQDLVLHNDDPKWMEARIDHKPPNTPTTYESPGDIELRDEQDHVVPSPIGVGNVRITDAIHEVPSGGKRLPGPACWWTIDRGGITVYFAASAGLARRPDVIDKRTGRSTLKNGMNPRFLPDPFVVRDTRIGTYTVERRNPDGGMSVTLTVTDTQGRQAICTPDPPPSGGPGRTGSILVFAGLLLVAFFGILFARREDRASRTI